MFVSDTIYIKLKYFEVFRSGGYKILSLGSGRVTEEDEEFWEVGVVDSEDIDASGVLGLSGEV